MQSKDLGIKIHKEIPTCITDDLIKIRTGNKFWPMSIRQWLDFNDKKTYRAIENEPNSDGKLPFDYHELKVGGYMIDQLIEGYKNADKAGDKKAADMITKMIDIYFGKLRSVRPVITVKKVLGWNAGYIYDKPWFATCWVDKKGRTMMDVLLSLDKDFKMSDNELDEICEENDIYHKLPGFKKIEPFKDRINYTFYVDKYVEGEEYYFRRLVIMLKKSANEPKVCDAKFCSVESLNEFNKLMHIENSNPVRRVSAKNRLDNETLKTINVEDIRIIYYSQHLDSRRFIIVTENKKRKKDDLVPVGKNIFAKQVNYTWYTGVYGTQELLPDSLNAKLGFLLDNDEVRKKYDGQDSVFAFDNLVGCCGAENFIVFNNTMEHLFVLEGDFRDAFMDVLNKEIVLPSKIMNSNVRSDLGSCWTKMVAKHFGMKEEEDIKFKRIKSPEEIKNFKLSDVVAFEFATSEARGWPGLVRVVMKKSRAKIVGFSMECMGAKNKENLKWLKTNFPFLDSKEIAKMRDEQNGNAITKEVKKQFVSAFDLFRGGFNFLISDTDWRWYDVGFGNNLFVPNKYVRPIFSKQKMNEAIKDKKFEQMAERNRQELYNVIIDQWTTFFDEAV